MLKVVSGLYIIKKYWKPIKVKNCENNYFLSKRITFQSRKYSTIDSINLLWMRVYLVNIVELLMLLGST